MEEEREELFTEKFYAGRRTYFLDVKETSKGDKYLVITESKKVEDDFERHQIFVYEEDILKFSKAFNSVMDFILENQ